MTIDKNLEGAWRICENINGYLETQVYYFYTKKDAIKKFREHKKAIINRQKETMQTHKKYQYLYLKEKLHTLNTESLLYDVGHSSFLPIFNRIDFYYKWLDKINKKYNYIN